MWATVTVCVCVHVCVCVCVIIVATDVEDVCVGSTGCEVSAGRVGRAAGGERV